MGVVGDDERDSVEGGLAHGAVVVAGDLNRALVAVHGVDAVLGDERRAVAVRLTHPPRGVAGAVGGDTGTCPAERVIPDQNLARLVVDAEIGEAELPATRLAIRLPHRPEPAVGAPVGADLAVEDHPHDPALPEVIPGAVLGVGDDAIGHWWQGYQSRLHVHLGASRSLNLAPSSTFTKNTADSVLPHDASVRMCLGAVRRAC